MKVILLMIALSISAFAQDAKPNEPAKPQQSEAAKPVPRLVTLTPEQQSPFLALIKERDEIYQQYQLRLEGAWIMLRALLGLEVDCQLEPTADSKLRVKCPPKPEASRTPNN